MSNLLRMRMTSVSNSAGWRHSSDSDRRMERYLSRRLVSVMEGERSGRERKRSGKVLASTMLECLADRVTRLFKTADLANQRAISAT